MPDLTQKSFTNGHSREEEPPSRGWRIALTVNLKYAVQWGPDAPPDAGAEFDQLGTVEAIRAALEVAGHQVHVCQADHSLPQALLELKPDFVFNIAEGVQGDAREAQVPALCELLGIPYTASRVLSNALSLDKTQTKRIWQSFGLPTPRFQEFSTGREPIDPALRFPLFVKPAREGTGMGMGPESIVHSTERLRARVAWVIETYRQPALVEEFLTGREFTVGFIGNPGFPGRRRRPSFYNFDGYHFFPVLEIDADRSVTPGVYGYDAKSLDLDHEQAPGYLCPADIPVGLTERLVELTRQASEAIGVCDVARVDFRLDAAGEPHLLEINTLPGLNPLVSDLCIMAEAEGTPYQMLITEILALAAERFRRPSLPTYSHLHNPVGSHIQYT
jgi:D-alanine-D-alanine ligase